MRRMLLALFGIILSSTLFGQTNSSVTHIVIPPAEKSAGNGRYFFPHLLTLAMEKTVDSHGSFTIENHPLELTRNRLISELEKNNAIHVIWAMTSPEREAKLHPIKISLLKDLNDYRIFLIRENDQRRFSKIESLDDLRLLRAGQGSTWPDTEILKANRIPVITAMHYDLLFDMLAANRFDYFPRGIYEIWDEYNMHAKKGLVIEKHLMLYYHRPVYFFTNKQNQALAERIEMGLKLAMEDGSFDALFYSFEGFKMGDQILKEHQRKIFELKTH